MKTVIIIFLSIYSIVTTISLLNKYKYDFNFLKLERPNNAPKPWDDKVWGQIFISRSIK